eukprot:2077-Chlamydomonas_euryale.AAC.7
MAGPRRLPTLSTLSLLIRYIGNASGVSCWPPPLRAPAQLTARCTRPSRRWWSATKSAPAAWRSGQVGARASVRPPGECAHTHRVPRVLSHSNNTGTGLCPA